MTIHHYESRVTSFSNYQDNFTKLKFVEISPIWDETSKACMKPYLFKCQQQNIQRRSSPDKSPSPFKVRPASGNNDAKWREQEMMRIMKTIISMMMMMMMMMMMLLLLMMMMMMMMMMMIVMMTMMVMTIMMVLLFLWWKNWLLEKKWMHLCGNKAANCRASRRPWHVWHSHWDFGFDVVSEMIPSQKLT